MRKRSHQRGATVVLGSLAASIALNLLVGLPVLALLGSYLQGTGEGAKNRPVKVVQLSAAQWSKNRETANAAAARKAGKSAPTPSPSIAVDEKKKPAPKVEKKPEPEEKLSGRLVEVPPTRDDSPNREAKYLSKYNTHVEKETTARQEDVDLKEKRVANERTHLESKPTASEKFVPTPNLNMKGNGGVEDRTGPTEKKGALAERRRFIFEMPDLMRRDAVKLQPGVGAGLGEHVADRTGSEAMRGNSSQLRIQEGSGTDDQGAEPGSSKKGSLEGAEDKKPLPTLAAVMPAMGVPGKVAGAPHDHVDGLPEGDGTFLNTKEFKYATFLYRVRDSVASYWEDFVSNEYRRRDPTGNVYGMRDRSTVLRVQLDRAGKLSDVRIEQTSGVDFLDHVAVEAFKKAEPFPNPPAGLVEEDGAIRFNFQFVVTMHSRGAFNVFQFK